MSGDSVFFNLGKKDSNQTGINNWKWKPPTSKSEIGHRF